MDKIQCSWNGKVHRPPKIEHCVVNKSTYVLHAFCAGIVSLNRMLYIQCTWHLYTVYMGSGIISGFLRV